MFDLFDNAIPAAPKELRPHQTKALQMLRQSLAKEKRVVLQMPTGAGKTLTAAKIIEGALAKGNRVIITVPAVLLIEQTVRALETEGIRDIGVMQADHPRTNALAKVQVASVHTLRRREIPDAALVIVDECHIRAEVIEKLMDERPDVFFIGLSATPWARGMGLHWKGLLIPMTIGDLIEQGFLSRFTAYAPDLPDLSGVKTCKGDYAESGLKAVMGDAKLMGNVVTTWLERGENRPTLCFAVNRAHAAQLVAQFERNGVATAYVDSYTDRVEREVINQRFKAGEVKIICSVRTMTTGVDLPVSCIIDAAPTKSEMLHVQKIGRGLRVNPGTEDCIILDHAGNSIRLGLVTDIRHDSLDKTRPSQKQERKATAEKLPKPCAKCEALFTGKTCPSCGHERVAVADVNTTDGELVEITHKKAVATMAEKERFWSMALHLDQQRHKGGRMAWSLYRDRFGEPPEGLSDTTLAPNRAFMNYEKSRRIRYAKRKSKQQEAT
ncbi:MAG: DEAD/DEAH box helicase [Loktanella sp.]|nr:DEAD/DEAH box helicase [Loktanella sp.]